VDHHGLDAAERAANPVMAPVDGWLVLLPETATTCGVMLLPDVEVMKALTHDGIGELAFYFHSLDLQDLITRFKATATKKLKRGVTAAKQLEDLAKGLVPLHVDAGDDIAIVAQGSDTKGLLEVEVLFAPRRGSYVGALRSLAYAMRLANPANRVRRMDPMSFYFRVKRGIAAHAKIASSHATHAFWTATSFTRRGLIEVRDEYDRPFATASRSVLAARRRT
jgi:hypothetical protein